MEKTFHNSPDISLRGWSPSLSLRSSNEIKTTRTADRQTDETRDNKEMNSTTEFKLAVTFCLMETFADTMWETSKTARAKTDKTCF
jgi:hypothetical protein